MGPLKTSQAFINSSLISSRQKYQKFIFDVYIKLMQSNRPPAKIRSKSDSNRLLIDFFDPNLAVQSIVPMIPIQIWIQI